jgi:hypothetical protein
MTRLRVTLFLAAMALASALVSEPYSVTPQLIDSFQLENYRKIWGSPDGAFFLQKKSGAEIRRYPSAEYRNIAVRGNQKLISSERGNFYALVSYSNFLPTQLQVVGITVFDRFGKEIWSIKEPGCNAFILCNHAPVVVGIAGGEGLAESRLIFFNSSGEMVGTAAVQNFYNGQFCENGEFFFGITGSGDLLKFTNTGKEVQNYGHAVRYFSSYDASLVAVVSDSASRIFSLGTALMTWPGPPQALREMRFSRDNRLVSALYGDRLEVFDLKAGSSIAAYALDDSAYRFFHFDTDSNFSYFVCGANNSADPPEIKNTKGRIMLLGAAGNLMWGEEVAYEEWSVVYPDVRIDSINRVVSLLTASALQVYKF